MGRGDGYIAPRALPFKPGTVTWRVNLEPGLMLGGGRALLLQVAHPLVAAGVAQHSDYQSDPWARLAAGPLNLVTAGLLPPSVRHDYGLAWSDERERLLTAFFAIVGLVARFVPRPLRQLPGLYAVQRTKPLMPPRFLRAEKAGPAR